MSRVVEMASPEALAAEQFESRVLGAIGPVLVDCTADWCVPCQRLGAYLPKLSREWQGCATIYTLDADANLDLCHLWRVEAYPCVLLFDHGELRGRIQGFEGYAQLRAAAQSFVLEATGHAPKTWPGESIFAAQAEAAEQAYTDATLPAAEALGQVLEPYWPAHEAEIALLDRRVAAGEMTKTDRATRVATLNERLTKRAAAELATQRQVTATALAAYGRAVREATTMFFGMAATPNGGDGTRRMADRAVPTCEAEACILPMEPQTRSASAG